MVIKRKVGYVYFIMYVVEFGWVLVNFVGVFDLEKYVIWFNDFYFSNFVKLFFLKRWNFNDYFYNWIINWVWLNFLKNSMVGSCCEN